MYENMYVNRCVNMFINMYINMYVNMSGMVWSGDCMYGYGIVGGWYEMVKV